MFPRTAQPRTPLILAVACAVFLSPATVGAQPHDPRAGTSDEPLSRMVAFVRAYDVSPETVQLVVEETLQRRPSLAAVEQSMSQAAGRAEWESIPESERERRRQRVLELMATPATRRYVLFFQAPAMYRLESTTPVFMDLNGEDPHLAASSFAAVQSAGTHWTINHAEQDVEIRHAQQAIGAHIPTVQDGWGPCMYFINLGRTLDVLKEIRGAEPEVRTGDEAVARARLPQGSSRVVRFSYRPAAPAAQEPIASVLIAYPQEGRATLMRLLDWRGLGGVPRAHTVQIDSWEGLEQGAEITFTALSERPPDIHRRLEASLLRLNEAVDSSAFFFDPPDDYRVIEQQADGTWRTLRTHPLEPAGPTERQRRIQDSLAAAATPKR